MCSRVRCATFVQFASKTIEPIFKAMLMSFTSRSAKITARTTFVKISAKQLLFTLRLQQLWSFFFPLLFFILVDDKKGARRRSSRWFQRPMPSMEPHGVMNSARCALHCYFLHFLVASLSRRLEASLETSENVRKKISRFRLITDWSSISNMKTPGETTDRNKNFLRPGIFLPEHETQLDLVRVCICYD